MSTEKTHPESEVIRELTEHERSVLAPAVEAARQKTAEALRAALAAKQEAEEQRAHVLQLARIIEPRLADAASGVWFNAEALRFERRLVSAPDADAPPARDRFSVDTPTEGV